MVELWHNTTFLIDWCLLDSEVNVDLRVGVDNSDTQ